MPPGDSDDFHSPSSSPPLYGFICSNKSPITRDSHVPVFAAPSNRRSSSVVTIPEDIFVHGQRATRNSSSATTSTNFDVTVDPVLSPCSYLRVDCEDNRLANLETLSYTDSPSQEIEVSNSVDPSISLTGIDRLAVMDHAAEIKKQRIVINNAELYVATELDMYDISKLTIGFVQDLSKAVGVQINSVRAASASLCELDAEAYEKSFKKRAVDTLKKLAGFNQTCQESIRVHEANKPAPVPPVVPPTGKRVKQHRVDTYSVTAQEHADSLKQQLCAIWQNTPSNEYEFNKAMEQYDTYAAKGRDLIKELDGYISDAMDCGLDDQAISITSSRNQLKDELTLARDNMYEHKSGFGIVGNSANTKLLDFKPPLFSGDPEADKKDFFSFKSEFLDYAASKALSHPDRLKVLQRTCLTGLAQSECEQFNDIEEIWAHLKKSYGNPKLLLSRKLDDIRKLGQCPTTPVKRREWAGQLQTRIKQVQELADRHSIVAELYDSGIYEYVQRALPSRLQDDLLDKIEEKENENDDGVPISREHMFLEMVKFLDRVVSRFTFEINYSLTANKLPEPVQPKPNKNKAHNVTSAAAKPVSPKPSKKSNKQKAFKNLSEPDMRDCHLCKEKHSHIFYCKVFLDTEPKHRFRLCLGFKSCMVCLRLDASISKDRDAWWSKHKQHCQDEFVCTEGLCAKREGWKRIHFSVCKFHVAENREKAEALKKVMNTKLMADPSQNIFFHATSFCHLPTQDAVTKIMVGADGREVLPDINQSGIFMLQTISINGKELLIFYDSGCMGAAVSDRACAALKSEVVRPGPTELHVAGGQSIILDSGDERFYLPIDDGTRMATITGLRMKNITSTFPRWELREAWNMVNDEYTKKACGQDDLPRVANYIGGKPVDIMIGIRYLQYFPELVYTHSSGLQLLKSRFHSDPGFPGVLAGPSEWFKSTDIHTSKKSDFLSVAARAFNMITLDRAPEIAVGEEQCEAEPDAQLEALLETEDESSYCSGNHCETHLGESWRVPANWVLNTRAQNIRTKMAKFEELENLGAASDFRCVACRNCADCRRGEFLDKVSLHEELEQSLIEKSVSFNKDLGIVECKLPFIKDPTIFLQPNQHCAEAVLRSQMRQITNSPETKADILKAHAKLLDKGHVQSVSTLSESEKTRMNVTPGCGFVILWRTVHKQSSLSTPVRVVYDASAKTPGGESLNSILAKGQNVLLQILHVLIRFTSKPYAVACDIAMAYNGVKLLPEYYKYQQYLWYPDLDEQAPIEVMVVKTLIYGVKSSGNLTDASLKLLADYVIQNVPKHTLGAVAVRNFAYVDDITDVQDSEEKIRQVADDIDYVLGMGGMYTKAYTFSGQAPHPDVSTDGSSVGLLGYIWRPVEDTIELDIKGMFFGKVKRGKIPPLIDGDITEHLKKCFTRRTLVSKVAAVFDPRGLVTPILAKLKLDLHGLNFLKLDWDDNIPLEYLPMWVENLEAIQRLKGVVFRRSIIPDDAINLDVEYIVSVDASENIGIAVVHSRVRKKDGTYFVQLVAAKSKLLTCSTIPRAELKAMVMGATLSHVCVRNMAEQVKNVIYVSDSAISLYWISLDTRPLQLAIRNSVIEVRRFSSVESWYHIESENNLADLGTRPTGLENIGPGSEWQEGKAWMKLDFCDMPLKTCAELTLSAAEKKSAAAEIKANDLCGVMVYNLRSKVSERYAYSKYVVDPCVLHWPKPVRVLVFVRRFIEKLKTAVRSRDDKSARKLRDKNQPLLLTCSDDEIAEAEKLFFIAATREVKKFSKPSLWKHCSVMKDGVLYSTSRILDGQEVTDLEQQLSDVQPMNFVKPLVDRYSPIAYSVMLHVHKAVVHHRNAATTLRESRNIVYVLQGRELSIEVRNNCTFCKRFKAKLIQVEMGKVHPNRLTCAPVFYHTQVDLFGPYEAMCEHNHRAVVKVWGCAFKDPATGAVVAYVMAGYHTEAFLNAYTRFASRFGHPKKLYIDQGGQLMKACKEAVMSITDLNNTLNTKNGVSVEFTTCPVLGHNFHGQVERSIAEIKRLFNTVFRGLKLDILSYETVFAWICNELNSLPICLGSRYENLDHTDLITPNRLMLGRNNRRSPSGAAKLANPSRLLKQQCLVEQAWWETWRRERLADYIPQPRRWQTNSPQPKKGDIVVFLKEDKEQALGTPVWRLGRVRATVESGDGLVRTLEIEYRNATEKVFRTTRRAVRSVAVVHEEGELELVEQLNAASRDADISFFISPSGN